MANNEQPEPFSFIRYATDMAAEAGEARAVRLDFPREPDPKFFLNASVVVPVAKILDAEPEGPFRMPEVVNRASLSWIVSANDRLGHLVLHEFDSEGKDRHLDLGPVPKQVAMAAEETLAANRDFCAFHRTLLEGQIAHIPVVESGNTTPFPLREQASQDPTIEARFAGVTFETLVDVVRDAGLEGLIRTQPWYEWNEREDVKGGWEARLLPVNDGERGGAVFLSYEPQTLVTGAERFVINTRLQFEEHPGSEMSLSALLSVAARSFEAQRDRAAAVEAVIPTGQPRNLLNRGVATPDQAPWYVSEALRRAADPSLPTVAPTDWFTG